MGWKLGGTKLLRQYLLLFGSLEEPRSGLRSIQVLVNVELLIVLGDGVVLLILDAESLRCQHSTGLLALRRALELLDHQPHRVLRLHRQLGVLLDDCRRLVLRLLWTFILLLPRLRLFLILLLGDGLNHRRVFHPTCRVVAELLR